MWLHCLSVIREELSHMIAQQFCSQVITVNWLKQYEVARRRDNLIMMSAMDLLYSTFSNNNLPLKLLRNLGLKLANHAGPLKNNAMKYAMGL